MESADWDKVDGFGIPIPSVPIFASLVDPLVSFVDN